MSSAQPITVTLDVPFECEGRLIQSLAVHEPCVRDIIACEKQGGSEAEKELNLIAALCHMAPQSLLSMKARDYSKLQEACANFFMQSQSV